MSLTRPDRRVVTFYSFKGGAGRTMALANVAFRLATMHALNVVAVDWDLEAPGLHEFFGLGPDEMARARGVLDYLEEWGAAARRGDPAPPDVTGWLLPVGKGSLDPRPGSLSLLAAGRMDDSYDRRLAALDWKTLYSSSGGALAVEILRKQLVARADVVLIDSRTGMTDAGGICTVQLPDGVILMAAPNQQSLGGIAPVARSIRSAPPEQRAGRPVPRRWLAICRVPSVEETFLTEQWFKEKTSWFSEGIQEGLWLAEDHRHGMRTFEIPQRARWSFGESILRMDTEAERREPLSIAYDVLTVTLLSFCVEAAAEGSKTERESIETLRTIAREAESRRDIEGLLLALIKLGSALSREGAHEEAIEVLRRGADMAVGAERLEEQAELNALLGSSLARAGRHVEAVDAGQTALRIARELQSRTLEVTALICLSDIERVAGNASGAQSHMAAAIALLRSFEGSPEELDRLAHLAHLSLSLHKRMAITGQIELFKARARAHEEEAALLLYVIELRARKSLDNARERGDREEEAEQLERLLELTKHGHLLGDEDVLRSRLAVLKEGAAPEVKRSRRRRRT